jgi:hypothetical protein
LTKNSHDAEKLNEKRANPNLNDLENKTFKICKAFSSILREMLPKAHLSFRLLFCNVGIIGYGVLVPVIFLLLGIVFYQQNALEKAG